MALTAMSPSEKDELATSLACLCLYDGEKDITSDAIAAIVAAAKVEVAPYWAPLFAKLLAGKNVEELLLSGGGGGGSGGGNAAADGEAAAEEEKEEEEEEEEIDMGGGAGLFGDDDDY